MGFKFLQGLPKMMDTCSILVESYFLFVLQTKQLQNVKQAECCDEKEKNKIKVKIRENEQGNYSA